MNYSSSDYFSHKIWRGSLLILIITMGLLSIVGTGGGGGNGAEHGVLQFSAATYSGDEDSGDITVTITRTGGSDGAATVDVSDASSGSATSGADYTAIPTATLSWADGESTSKTITISVIADGTVESDETVDLALGNATGAALGTITASTVTILNDDIAATPGTLQFSLSNYSGTEGDGTVTITVTRTGGNTGAVGVSYASSNGTAMAGSDYTAVSSTLSWADGISTAQTFDVPIIDDTDVEVPETVNLTLSSPTGGVTLGSPNTATLTITSDDTFGTIRFSATSYNVDETDGAVTDVITLQRVNGSSGAVSVDVSDLGTGTATSSGTDYTFASPTTVSWTDGDTMDKNVTIALVDDVDVESTETVNLSLGNVTGGASIGSPSTATVNIADDDSVAAFGEVQFDATAYSVDENGVSVTITVNRINGSSGVVGVSYATSNNTATAGSDYTSTFGTLSWADGESGAQTFQVDIINDAVVEGDETITLALNSPTGGATLGTPNTATLTINDDDTNLTMDIGDGSSWVAFQDGPSGTWTEWSPTSGNTYDFPVTDGSGRYGVAFHRTESDGVHTVEKTYVVHATIGELSSLDAFNNLQYSVSGTLSNYTGSNDSAGVVMHLRHDGGDSVIDPYSYTLRKVSGGNRDLLAFEWLAPNGIPDNFVVRRNINVASDLVGQNIDFTTDTDVEALAYTPNSFVGSSAGQELEVYFATDNGTSFDVMSDIYDGSTALFYPYFTNASMKQTGDAYSFQIFNSTGTRGRIRNQSATTDPGAQSLGLGSVASLTGTSVSATQVTGLSYTPDPTSFSGSPVFRGYQVNLDQTVSGIDGGTHWHIIISKDWLDTSTTYTYPSLSAVSGYNVGWGMGSGTQTNATVSAATSNGGTGLSLIIRKTIGLNSNNLNEDSWTIAKKLAQNDSLKLDVASQFSTFTW